MLDRVADRGESTSCNEVAGPVVSRVIGSFIGTPEEDDQRHIEETNMVLGFGDEDLRPTEEAVIEMMTRAWDETMEMIAERRATPGMDDLMDVLVHSEVDGEKLSDTEIFMGLGLLGAAGNDSTRSVFTSGMLGLFESPDQLELLLDDPRWSPARSRSCCGCTRPSRTSAAPRPATSRCTARRSARATRCCSGTCPRTATRTVYEDPQRLDVTRDARPPGVRRRRPPLLPRRSAGAARDQDPAERDAAPLPGIELAGEPSKARSMFLNQLKTLPVRLNP